MTASVIPTWEERLNEVLIRDRHRLRQALRRLREAERAKKPIDQQLVKFEADFRRSSDAVKSRASSVPAIEFPADLPIIAKRDEIAAAIRDHQVVIVCGETGSGKSTQLPKLCLSLGRGVAGMIGHTQPRRVAARTIAARVADELKRPLGSAVGFKVRFTDATQPNTLIKLMTDGVMLAETRTDRFLDQYDTIIVDEAHERSLNIDFLLGYLKRLLPKRPDLKLIITSATIDAARFAEHFGSTSGPAPILEVSGRMYPVEVRWRGNDSVTRSVSEGERTPNEVSEHGELAEVSQLERSPSLTLRVTESDDPQRVLIGAVDELVRENLWDILIFQPTEWDIHETAKLLRAKFNLNAGRKSNKADVEILPLYARLTLAEQQRVFEPKPGQRRIVIATNVAESSLTVPGIRAVIDTGTARISRYSPRTKMQRLPIEAISQASADQRKGRCGRIGPGVCIRLFDQKDYEARERFTPPEILRTNLASVILQTESLNLGAIEDFPFLEPPKPTAIRDGYKTLFELGAVNDRNQLTDIGRKLAKLPVDPRIARIILAGQAEGCLNDILIIAAALEAQDPRDRPLEKQQAADEKHKQFQHPDSDFIGYLKLWDFFHHLKATLSKSQVRKACVQNFLNFNRLREWADLHRQLVELVEESGMKVGKRRYVAESLRDSDGVARPESSKGVSASDSQSHALRKDSGRATQPKRTESDSRSESATAIHRALLTGFLANIANRDSELPEYSAAGGLKANVWPGSGVFATKPKWIVAAELVETSKRYLRTVARIDPAWIEPLAEHLLTKNVSEPHWDREAGSAMGYERVTLFGLTIVPRRRVRLGRIDPATARRLFIQHALVEGDFECRHEFFKHNRALVEELEALRIKSRRADFLKSDAEHFRFYDERLPPEVIDGVSLSKWLKAKTGGSPNVAVSLREAANAPQTNKLALRSGREVSSDRSGADGALAASRSETATLATATLGEATALGRTAAFERTLFLRREDLLNSAAAEVSATDFPSELQLPNVKVALSYRLEPGSNDDGITISVPQAGLNQLEPQRLGWLVPGLLEVKVIALIKSLPKETRRLFVPVPETAKQVLQQLRFGEGDVNAAVAAILSKLSGQRIDPREFREDDLPPHLRISVRVVGENGKTLGSGRDLDQLRQQLGAKAAQSFAAIDHSQWNRDGLTDWDFDLLPESVDLQHAGLKLKGYPSLVDRGESVSLRLADSVDRASHDTRLGLRRLLVIAANKDLKKQVQHLPDLSRWMLLIATLPDKARLPQQLAELISDRALFPTSDARLPRTKTQFQELMTSARRRIPAAVQDVVAVIGPLVTAYTEARRAIESCRLPFAQTAVADCRGQLTRLTEAGFLTATPWDWLQQFPRYFNGITLRLKKLAAGGQARDQRARSEIDPRQRKLLAKLEAAQKASQHLPSVITARWMLEELRISLFAQELRTAVPISPQRWDKQWDQVEQTS